MDSVRALIRSPGEEHGNPPQYSCLESPHGQRSLACYSSWSHKQLGMTKHMSQLIVFLAKIHPLSCNCGEQSTYLII